MRTPAVPVCFAAEQQQKVHRPLGFGEGAGTRYGATAGKPNDLHLETRFVWRINRGSDP